jgi:transcriptional regulator with XRE-family HTH domain
MATMTQERYGDRMRAARKAAELTQEQVAARIGVGQRSISDWENDRAEPSLAKFRRFMLACRTSADEMLQIRQPSPSDFAAPTATAGSVESDAKRPLLAPMSYRQSTAA